MKEIIIVVARFVFALLMALYTFASYKAYYKKDNNTFFRCMQLLSVLLFLTLGFFILYLDTNNADVIGIASIFAATVAVFYGIYRLIYGTNMLAVITNIIMLMTLSVIMLTRLSITKAKRQVIFIAAGLLLCLILPYIVKKMLQIRNAYIIAAVLAFVLLLVVVAIGKKSYGALLSINIGIISFQPFEIVKLLYVIFLAGMLKKNSQLKGVVLAGLLSLMYIGILVFANDFGSVLILAVVFLLMVFIASRNPAYIFAGAAAAVLFGAAAIRYVSHIRVRFEAWSDPFSMIDDKGYQMCQSLFAITAGGFFGTGLTKGMPQKIPVVEKDFIYSAVCEEFGLLVAVLLLFLIIFNFIVIIDQAMMQKNLYKKYIVFGLAITNIFQIFLTIGGAVKFIPSTGVTLPFVSYGGSSLIGSFLLVTILIAANIPDKKRLKNSSAGAKGIGMEEKSENK